MSYCPHCMQPASGPVCPNCGRSTQWTPAAGQLPAGTVLDGGSLHRYQTGAALGQGGFGITYIGKELESGVCVAIKECFPVQCAVRSVDGVTVEPKPGQEQIFLGARSSFLEEARLLARQTGLRSMVQVREFFQANGTAYLVMEFLDGETLETRVKRIGKLPAQELLYRLRPLIEDLNRLHMSGIIHRDISPDNLMWMPDGTIRLLDFGCARAVENGKSVSVLLKHGFAPVEQYQTRGQGGWTDVYALCATIYYCITGTMPTPAVERLEGAGLTPPTHLGAELTPKQETALLWGLEVQPTARPQTMELLATALYADPLGFPQKQDIKPGWNFTFSKKSIGILAGAAAVIVVAIVLVVSLGGRDEPGTGYNAPPRFSQQATQPTLTPGEAVVQSQDPEEAVVQSQEPEQEPEPVTGVTDDGYEYVVEGEVVWISGYTGSGISLSMPDTIEGMDVVGIGERAFLGNKTIETIFLPINLREIGEAAFYGCSGLEEIYSYSSPEGDQDACGGCTSLRAILKHEEDEITRSGWDLPDDVGIYDRGMDIGDGALHTFYVDDRSILYGITEEDNAVVLDFPNDEVELAPRTEVAGHTVTWIYDEAIQGMSEVPTVYLDGEILISADLALSPDVEFHTQTEEGMCSLSYGWYASCVLAEAVEMERDYAAKMEPDIELIQAAMTRVEELKESYSHERPDGESWGTLLDDMGFNWSHGMEYIDNTDDEEFGTILDKMMDSFSEWNDSAEDYLQQFGMAIGFLDGTFYVCGIGTVV